jgi:cation transport ATPase
MGCQQVFHMLLESSEVNDPAAFRETDLFKKCQEIGIIPKSESDLIRLAANRSSNRPAVKTSESKTNGDASEIHNLSESDTLSLQLKISDMWCPACAWVIGETLNRNHGVVSASCNFSTDRLRCEYDPIKTSPDRIINIINDLGYKTLVAGEEGIREKKVEFIRFVISALLTMNVMMLSFALYSGFFSELTSDSISKLSWPLFFMASIVLFYGGHNIFKKALAGFTSAATSMETLIAIGSLSAYIYSFINLLTGNIHLYFDTASMLITLVLLGKILERGAKNKVQQDLDDFFALQPTKVRVATASYPKGRYVAARQLRRGDNFLIQTAEVVPADGLILDGALKSKPRGWARIPFWGR